MRATTGTSAQRRIASASPIGRPIRMPASDSVNVTTAPSRIDKRSPALIAGWLRLESELGFPLHRQIGEGFAEPLLLQLGKAAAFLLLGDEAVQEVEQFGIAL